MPNALVTGSAGFVGRHMVAELRTRGYDVTGADIKRSDPIARVTSMNMDDCRNVFRYDVTHYDLVVHAAAVVGGRKVIDDSPLVNAVNIEMDSLYFRWLAKVRPKRAVYLSSSAVYPIWYQSGAYLGHQLREHIVNTVNGEHIGVPDSIYGWSKMIGEVLAQYTIDAGVSVTIVRPASGYGADQDLDYPTPTIVKRAVDREDPLVIWSNTTRDFIHIDDVVAAVLAAVDDGVTEPVNICTGRGTTFKQLAQIAADIVGYSPEIQVLKDMPTGVDHRVLDPTMMHKFYEPKISLEVGIERMIKNGQ